MVTTYKKTYYPSTITQTEGGHYKKFSNINNIKGSANFAEATIGKKTDNGNRPSIITASKFGVSLPTGAEISQIKVEYAHQRIKTNGYTCSIAAPTITLTGLGIIPDGATCRKVRTAKNANQYKKVCDNLGVAPTLDMVQRSKTFKFNPVTNKVTSSNFAVKINYPANTGNYGGKLRLKYIRVVITYTKPSYGITLSKVETDEKEVGDLLNIKASISNLNKTAYNPSVTFALSEGLTYKGKVSGSGTLSIVNGSIKWNPGINAKVSSKTITFQVQLDTAGWKRVQMIETLTTVNRQVTFSVYEQTGSISNESDENQQLNVGGNQSDVESNLYILTKNQFSNIPVVVDDEILTEYGENEVYLTEVLAEESVITLLLNDDTEYTYDPEDATFPTLSDLLHQDEEDNYYIQLKSTQLGSYTMNLYYGDGSLSENIISTFIVTVVPYELSYTDLTIFTLSEEELLRLSDGRNYTVQSYFKITNHGDHTYYDFLKNFRVAVFNGEVPVGENFAEYLFDNAPYWSKFIENPSNYNNVTCEFVYDKNYPVYIIITGQYLEFHSDDYELDFTEPCVGESTYFKQYEPPGKFPYSITNVITDGDSASMSINSFEKSNSIIMSQLPLENDTGTNDFMAVQGIELKMNLAIDNNVVVLAKLHKLGSDGNGEVGERSLVLNKSTGDEIIIGDSNDTWGFGIGELTNLEDWEIELEFNNLFASENSTVNIQLNNIQMIIYYLDIENSNVITAYVNDENIAWYGVYLNNIELPAGLKTSNKYLTVEGTDINEAYRQTIESKKIKLDFSINGCNLLETTQLLRAFGHLLVNDRDILNRPVPNKIEFPEIYPGEHWDFLLEEEIENKVEISNYDGTVELMVYNGTSNSNEDTVTNAQGTNKGIANVRPMLTVLPLQEDVVITEKIHSPEQVFTIHYPFTAGKHLIEIDCNDMTVILKKISNEITDTETETALDTTDDEEGIDITAFVDMNADWFILYRGDFTFESDSAIIQTVQYNERG